MSGELCELKEHGICGSRIFCLKDSCITSCWCVCVCVCVCVVFSGGCGLLFCLFLFLFCFVFVLFCFVFVLFCFVFYLSVRLT